MKGAEGGRRGQKGRVAHQGMKGAEGALCLKEKRGTKVVVILSIKVVGLLQHTFFESCWDPAYRN
jgi:hypothetical protein